MQKSKPSYFHFVLCEKYQEKTSRDGRNYS